MIDGAKNTDAVVVVHVLDYGDKVLKERLGKKEFVSLNSLETLRGRKSPLVFDNCALYLIFREAAEEINRLEKEVAKLEERLGQYENVG
jgi:hypothetical protein